MTDKELASQYRDSRNLAARQKIYAFAEAGEPFATWLIHKLEFPQGARILELGCGHGMLWRGEPQWKQNRWDLVLTDLSAGMLTEARAGLRPIGWNRCGSKWKKRSRHEPRSW